ncbi:DUF2808 domain-containing protein [Nostoc sp. KVJ3]|uniref:DUF2808 domain-containing protein n=1 Tax=Nostoc sp. KVJ3 TaxID=457945 RepID=UPI002238B22C|nr:DUF2808 domain-containing protein [Nostoc sp. KVJ3]MCW5312864.1 DUF2808 domain-containing protein [Nostoc sp. KVJ3]
MLGKTIDLNKSSFVNRWLLSASTLTLSFLFPGLLLVSPALAIRLSNGQITFNNPPRLVRSATSSSSSNNRYATYQFTISVPKDAGEPLEAVSIVQRPNVETIAFDESQQTAFKGNSFAGGTALHLASIGGTLPSPSNKQTVVFDPPIAPGSTVTVEIVSKGNPQLGGVYLFGVTAYPAGENGIGQFLGYGRLHFYK